METIIEFRNYSCYYQHKKTRNLVLNEVSFEVKAGEIFVVVGPSGCGKTTLLKSMLGMCDYYSGDIFINGVSFEDIHGKDNCFGYVSQEHVLYPSMTIYENIALPLRVMGTPHEEMDARVRSMAKMLEIDWLLTRKPKQLSGGQQQRVALARALVREPMVLLLDEPFSELDPHLRGRLREELKHINSTLGCTTIFVTHDIQEAAALGDRIMRIEDGKVEEIMTPQAYLATIDT
jgi:multiple sugar transport system ATP-binding protein